jgi:hypothetical protein
VLLDLSFIQVARDLEVEAQEGGRRRSEFSVYPFGSIEIPIGTDDSPIALEPMDDILETEDRVAALAMYLPYARRAFQDRGMVYPFAEIKPGSRLQANAGMELEAQRCAELSRLPGLGGSVAKGFELRAVKALHRLIGGWAACVGSPRHARTGPKRAITRFRSLLVAEAGDEHPTYPPSGDFGLDAVWIMGRSWGGPIVCLQAKNAEFSITDLPQEFLRLSDVLFPWFGRRVDQRRAIIPVYAVNTVLTIETKERVFEAAGSPRGLHIVDAVDILLAENSTDDHVLRCATLEIL